MICHICNTHRVKNCKVVLFLKGFLVILPEIVICQCLGVLMHNFTINLPFVSCSSLVISYCTTGQSAKRDKMNSEIENWAKIAIHGQYIHQS